MAPRKLYDAVARAHDLRCQTTSDAPVCTRTDTHEDRRGVTPRDVNSLVPYIPPIDTSFPPPSKEWLDAMAKRILADLSHATPPDPDDALFDYDSDSTLDIATKAPAPPQPASDSLDTDSDSDTDIDMDTDDDRAATPTPPSHWLIRRKRPSVVIIHTTTCTGNAHHKKRPRGAKIGSPGGLSKPPKRHALDSPARHRRNGTPDSLPPAASSCPPVSSITAAALQMNLASPGIASPRPLPQPNIASPRSPKLFPCLLDGCTQVCASAGDLQRHQQSLRHRAPSYACLACNKSYTRSDALKRHLNSKASCKKEHAANLANNIQKEHQPPPEADDEAVPSSSSSA